MDNMDIISILLPTEYIYSILYIYNYIYNKWSILPSSFIFLSNPFSSGRPTRWQVPSLRYLKQRQPSPKPSGFMCVSFLNHDTTWYNIWYKYKYIYIYIYITLSLSFYSAIVGIYQLGITGTIKTNKKNDPSPAKKNILHNLTSG